MAAYRFDLFRNGQGAAPFRAFECHMLEQVGYAVYLGAFIARADIDPDADRCRFELWHVFAHHTQAIRQGRNLCRHATFPS